MDQELDQIFSLNYLPQFVFTTISVMLILLYYHPYLTNELAESEICNLGLDR